MPKPTSSREEGHVARAVYRSQGVALAVVETDASGATRLLRPSDPEGLEAEPVDATAAVRRYPLYRADEVTASIERGQQFVWVCHTELEADALTALGLTATVLAPSPLLAAGIALEQVASPSDLAAARCVVPLNPGVAHDPRVPLVTATATTTTVVRLEEPLLAIARSAEGLKTLQVAAMKSPPVSRGGGSEWPEPVELVDASADAAPFPVAALPAWVADHVNSVAAAMEVDATMPAAFALGALATVVAPRCRVQVTPSWQEGTNVYVVVGAQSGEKKSPVFNAVFRPVERIEEDRQREAKKEIITLQSLLAIAEKRVKDAEAALHASTGRDDDALVAELEAAVMRREEAAEACRPLPKMLVDDSSPEALTRMLYEQRGALAIASSEGLLFDLVGGRVYSGSGGVNLDSYLKAWSGDTLRVDRGGLRRSTHDIPASAVVRDPRLTVAIATQPEPLLRAFTDAELDTRGLTHRFLPVVPPSMVGRRTGRPPSIDPGHAVLWDDGLNRLADRFLALEEPLILEATTEAYDTYHAWWEGIEARRGPGEDLASLSPWLSKAEAYVWRLAGLLAVADDPGTPTSKLQATHVARAVELIECFLSHRQALATLGALSPVVSGAMRLLDWLRATRVAVFSRRDAYNAPANRASFPYAETVDQPLALLVEAGWVRALPADGGPGRPSQKFEVNPGLYTVNPAT